MEKKPPYNLEAEQAVLGAVFINNEVFVTILDRLNKDDFYDVRNQVVFLAMQKLNESSSVIDYATLISVLDANRTLSVAGGNDYVLGLVDATPSSLNIDAYIDIVANFALKRKLISTAQDIADMGYDGTVDAVTYIDKAEMEIFEVSKRRKTSEFSSFKVVAEEVHKKTERNRNRNGENVVGLVSGFDELDKATMGFQPGELIILAARPAMGKSALAMNFATNVAKYNKDEKAKVAIFSLEMPVEQIVLRMIACETTINSYDIKSGNLSQTLSQHFSAGIQSLSKYNLFFSDSSSVTVSEIRAKCRKMSQSIGLDLIVIDYLQLITGEGNRGNRQEEVSQISRSLKQLARELKVPIIALAQLSRAVEQRTDKRPVLPDLRESGSIEQDADVIMFLYRDEYYNKDSADLNKAELIIAKNRQGVSGNSISLLFEPEYSRFSNIKE